MSKSTTAITNPIPDIAELGASIKPCKDSTDNQHIQVIESDNSNVTGLLVRTREFAPIEGNRILHAPSDTNDFTQTTLRSGSASSITQTDEEFLVPGIGPDHAFMIKQCINNKVIEREVGNIGVILTNKGGDGNSINNNPKMVGRLTRINPETGENEYLQFINGKVVFAPSSKSQNQAFQWVSEVNGNFGIMKTNPQHRLDLGPSPLDDGKPFGANLGDYVIIGGLKLHVKDGQLYVNNQKVILEEPECQKCQKCNKSK